MRNLAVVLLLLAPALAAADPDQDRHRQRVMQGLEMIERLQLDNAMTKKLLPIISAYTSERDRLLGEYNSAEHRLPTISDAKLADQVLDDMLATQSALVAIEAQFVVKLRRTLPADQAAKARVLLADQQLPRREATPEPSSVAAVQPEYDRDALFPPGSPLRRPCDPFASMHGCRY